MVFDPEVEPLGRWTRSVFAGYASFVFTTVVSFAQTELFNILKIISFRRLLSHIEPIEFVVFGHPGTFWVQLGLKCALAHLNSLLGGLF